MRGDDAVRCAPCGGLELIVPGGFDLVHVDHVIFIGRCIAAAQAGRPLDRVHFVIFSDSDLRARRGAPRPFYPVEWRWREIERFVSREYPALLASHSETSLEE